MTNTALEIYSYRGVGPLVFGMPPSRVHDVVGAADGESKNHLGELVEYRGSMTLGFASDSQTLNYIGFGRQAIGVTYRGIRIFEDPPHEVLKELAVLDGDPYTSLGFVIFINLGIGLTGFHDGDRDQLAASVFVKGAWDFRKEKMKKISF